MPDGKKSSVSLETVTLVPERHQKLLSTLRLKVLLSVFLVLLLLAMSGLMFFLVTDIFGHLTPSLREDLNWKAQRGAAELAHSADVAIALGDRALVEKAFANFSGSQGVVGLVATDVKGTVLAASGGLASRSASLFQGKPGEVVTTTDYVMSWSEAAIEGNVVGRVAVALSTARLKAGERLRQRILGAAGIGCVLALGISLFFVNFYLVPLINLTQQGLRTSREMEIAKRIQTSILPRRMAVDTLDIAATMIPATEVGGDYYDVQPVEDGCWIGIGDVAGHGVQAGLIMMMVQSVVSGLVRKDPDASPSSLLDTLNRVLYENIRHRLRSDEHVTFSLLRYHASGRVRFAGAHEEILLCRAATGRCERIITPGPWLGAVKNVTQTAVDTELHLEKDDVLLLHTDGITEAQNAAGEQFGLARLVSELEKVHERRPDEIRAHILQAVRDWMAVQDDDVTLMVLRHHGAAHEENEDSSVQKAG